MFYYVYFLSCSFRFFTLLSMSFFSIFYSFPGTLEFSCLVTVTFKFSVLYKIIYIKNTDEHIPMQIKCLKCIYSIIMVDYNTVCRLLSCLFLQSTVVIVIIVSPSLITNTKSQSENKFVKLNKGWCGWDIITSIYFIFKIGIPLLRFASQRIRQFY